MEPKASPFSLPLLSPPPSVAGVGCREIRHSVVLAVLGHKYAGDIFLNIYSHVLLI